MNENDDAQGKTLAALGQSIDALNRIISGGSTFAGEPDPFSWTDDRFCTRVEASRLAQAMGLPVSKALLERLAVAGDGPPITYFGRRKPLYQVGEFKSWLAGRTSKARSTADLKRAAKAMRGGRDE